MNPEIISALKTISGEKQVFTDARSLEIFSLDHYWYSPVLLELLASKRADVVVAPANKYELLEVVRLAVKHSIPLTIRGAGTGNYGQCVPADAAGRWGGWLRARRVDTFRQLRSGLDECALEGIDR